ncbi:LAG1-domain-containing protein [Violaceomyces palustris]|uniref:LAG1-domain-containing protein n=1 Tax=Violaceomyces palustris TaxID=1673888 RepID=A0ACD0NUY9_9BASI|nr:LAG1-domain-containing protein [Violaceomyces palustris]
MSESSSVPPTVRPATGRPRAPSISDAITQAPQNTNAQDDGKSVSDGGNSHSSGRPTSTPSQTQSQAEDEAENERYRSQGILRDLVTFRWMTAPASSAKLAGIFVLAYLNWNFFTPDTPNPFRPFLFLSHQVDPTSVLLSSKSVTQAADSFRIALRSFGSPSSTPTELLRYQKGYLDLCFLAFYVVVFSFIRQTTTIYMFKPFAKWWGIKGEAKQSRFTEQGYSFLYWGTSASLGLYVMSFQDSWWYNLEHLWIEYPHWQMRPELKVYYLLQASYWLQQALVMLLRLEKPRKDYYELIAHHLVTLWLIFWSYLINLTMIGTTVFVCMDIPDTFLALAKGLNYMELDTLATGVFAMFMVVWTYFRIYLSAKTLWSVWFQFDLIPDHTKEWNPEKGWWLVPWMKYQIFAPLFLLLLLNLFWYYLSWRVLIRALKGVVADEREEDDDAPEGQNKAEGKKDK